MKLNEFFGHINLDLDQDKNRDSNSPSKEEENQLGDDLFWYILDHDDLHKNYFMPIAKELEKKYKKTKDNASHDWKEWAPMVNSGCMKYWKEKKIEKHPTDVFTKELRKEICKRLEEHYRDSITKDEHKLGK
jgi:hypothetical protein